MSKIDNENVKNIISNADSNGKEERNVPDLRLNTYCKLKEISDPITYGLGASAIPFDGIHTYIRITDIDDFGEYLYKQKVSPSFFSEEFLLNNNDILFARTGASVGKTYIHKESKNVYFAGFLMRVRIKEHNPYYIYQQFKTSRFQKWLSIMSIRSGQPGINANELGNYRIKVGTKSIENKIAYFMRILDKRIQTQKKIINLLESQIKSIKNKEFNNLNRPNCKLKNVLIETNNKTVINNQHEILSSTIDGIFKQSEYFDRQVASENNIGYKIVEKGNIIISPQNLWMGNITYNDKFDIGIVSPSYKIFNISNNYNRQYIFEMLNTKKSLYLFKTVSEQGASIVRRNLNYEAFLQLKFHIPSINHQNAFIEKLVSLQNKISIEKQILTLLEKQKQYLLQKLFI